MDMILQTTPDRITDLGTRAGTMNLIEDDRIDAVLAGGSLLSRVPGGSAANTVRGLAWLLGAVPEDERPVFSGGIGRDEAGDDFDTLLRQSGVHAATARKDVRTGVSVILVTEDAERTMFTHLGACREYGEQDVDFELLRRARYLHIAGYMWDTDSQKAAVAAATRFAEQASVAVSFDLADPFVVERYRAELLEWLPGKTQVLFANREELSLMAGLTDEESVVRWAGSLAPIVAMKIGRGGCILGADGTIQRVPGETVNAIDTTGAGDSFAAGFLFGLLRGLNLETCGRLANRLASRITTVQGCVYSSLDRTDVLSILEG
jgi:sugar/nucleoside kinase (ribokinase family)